MACNHWEHQWQDTVLSALGAVAWFILAARFVRFLQHNRSLHPDCLPFLLLGD